MAPGTGDSFPVMHVRGVLHPGRLAHALALQLFVHVRAHVLVEAAQHQVHGALQGIAGRERLEVGDHRAPDRNADLRDAIVALAQRYRRYGAGMISLKWRQQGRVVNHKRIERLYAEAQLQVRRRTRKKVPVGERQPLVRPAAAN